VVVGYVIDPEMTDQIRVTVVATGIGRPAAVRGLPQGSQPKVEVVAGAALRRGGLDNYADYDTPANMRRSSAPSATTCGRTWAVSRTWTSGVPAPAGRLKEGRKAVGNGR